MDQLVYELQDLTDEEIAIVEGGDTVRKTRATRNNDARDGAERFELPPEQETTASAALALAIVDRLNTLLTAFGGEQYLFHVEPPERLDWLYIQLRRALLQLVEEAACFSEVDRAWVHEFFPSSLGGLTPDEFVSDLWSIHWNPGLSRIQSELLSGCMDHGIDPYHGHQREMADWFIGEHLNIDVTLNDFRQQREELENRERQRYRLPLLPSANERKEETGSHTPKRDQIINRLRQEYEELIKSEQAQSRGFALERIVQKLFEAYELTPTTPFRRNDNAEQIDGGFYLDGHWHLCEVRWRAPLQSVRDVDGLYGQVDRAGEDARGLFISISGFGPAVATTVKQNRRKVMILMDGEDLHYFLENHRTLSLPDLLRGKWKKLELTAEPYVSAYELAEHE